MRKKKNMNSNLRKKKRKELTADVGQSAGGANRADGKAAGQNQTADGAAAHSEEALTKEAQIEKDGQAYMERLRELNIQIPGEVISNKLYKLDYLLKRIFQTLREHPEKSDQMRRFYGVLSSYDGQACGILCRI